LKVEVWSAPRSHPTSGQKIGYVNRNRAALKSAHYEYQRLRRSRQHSKSFGSMKLASIEAPEAEPPARLVVAEPLAAALARGLAVIPYYAENLRILPVYGSAALSVVPRLGHVHVTVDDSPWHWVDASGEAIIIQGLPPGAHRVLIELADPTHRVIDRRLVTFEIPPSRSAGARSTV
jgi:hypothetical protein